MRRALFIGRFQPFHNGHYKTVRQLLGRYNEVIIMIGTAQESGTAENPFTAAERIEMIKSCFGAEELSRLVIVAVEDVNDDSIWVFHIMAYTPEFDDVFSNNDLVRLLFLEKGVRVNPTPLIDRETNEGAKIRELIKSGSEEWENHVPKQVADYIKEKGITPP